MTTKDDDKDPNVISLSEFRRSLANHDDINTNAILYRTISVALAMCDKMSDQAHEIDKLKRRMVKLSTEVVRLEGILDD